MTAREPAMDVLADLDTLQVPQLLRRRISVDDYHRMAEVGLLPANDRCELIEGEIIDMAPMGSRHHSTILRLSRCLQLAVGDRALVSTQLPVRLGQHSEPEPDIALLKPRDDFYASALPTGPDCLLVIEVADTTLAYDVRIKVPLYAEHGVPEVWVLDLEGGLLRSFNAPVDGRYSRAMALRVPGLQALPGLPGCSIDFTGLI
jgi:Uma2 family endonuclease